MHNKLPYIFRNEKKKKTIWAAIRKSKYYNESEDKSLEVYTRIREGEGKYRGQCSVYKKKKKMLKEKDYSSAVSVHKITSGCGFFIRQYF